ncbi:MAG: NAD(P)-dependent oxidoreductase [Ruegeria sp.]
MVQPAHGFIGLGAMGGPIAARMATQFRLAVADRAQERIDAMLDAEKRDRSSSNLMADAAQVAQAKTVFLCLPTPQVTETVIADLLETACKGRQLIDLGAQPPQFVGRMVEICAQHGALYCDSPVFGTPKMAQRGELYFLFSGDEQAATEFRSLIEGLGYRMRYAGPAGAASSIKLLQNALGTANLNIGAEVLRLCEASGIDTGIFIDVVRECGGIGLSTVFDRFAEDMAARKDSGEGRLRIAAKDMRAALDLAQSDGVKVPLLEETGHQFDDAIAAGLGDRQFTSIIELAADSGRPGKGDAKDQ